MKEFHTQDGTIIHLPDTEQRGHVSPTGHVSRADGYCCSCHKRLGNDFYFLPVKSCLRPDKTCDNPPMDRQPR